MDRLRHCLRIAVAFATPLVAAGAAQADETDLDRFIRTAFGKQTTISIPDGDRMSFVLRGDGEMETKGWGFGFCSLTWGKWKVEDGKLCLTTQWFNRCYMVAANGDGFVMIGVGTPPTVPQFSLASLDRC